MSNSRGPETLTDLVAELGPHARAATALEAAEAADIAVVTVPMRAIPDVPVAPLAGKVVIDTCNYYPQRDGRIPELEDESTTTSELVQRHLPASTVVKAFNHIRAPHLTEHGSALGTPNRRALVIAADDADARRVVARLINSFGFDVVELESLAEGWRIERDTPGYVVYRTADQLRADLAAATRHRDA